MKDNYISPYELLKQYQKGTFEKLEINDKFFEELLQLYPLAVQEQMKTNKEEILTKYKINSNVKIPLDSQNPLMYLILYSYIKDIEEVLEVNNIVLNKKVVIGTVPITRVNAGQSYFGKEEVLILVYEGLFHFFYFMAAIVTSFYNKTNDSSIHKQIFDLSDEAFNTMFNTNLFGHNKFIEILICFKNKEFSILSDWFKTDFNKDASNILWNTAELFSIAHEFGHIMLEHNIDTAEMSEYRADYAAFRITMARNLNKGMSLTGAFCGIDFLFSCIELIEQIDPEYYISNSHPMAIERRLVLRSIFKDLFPQNYQNAFSLADINYSILSNLWNIHKNKII